MVPDAPSSVQLCVCADLIFPPLGPQVAVAAREAHRCDLLIFPSVGLTPRRAKHASSLLPSSPSCPPSCRQAYVHTSHLLLLLVAYRDPGKKKKKKACYIKEANVRPSSPSASAVQGSIRLPTTWTWN